MPRENAQEDRGWQIELRAAPASDKLEIAVHDVIGQSFWEDGVTSKDFLAALRGAPSAKAIELRINSLGGEVDQAKGMGNLLAERAAAGVTITGYVDGIAASAASYLLTFAHRVVMPSNAFQMLHGASTRRAGNAETFEQTATMLRRVNAQMAEAYAAASARRGKGKTAEDFLAMFAKGDTYLDADEAFEWGLADEKTEPLQVAACLVDLGERAEAAPEAVRAAPYITTAQSRQAASAPAATRQGTPEPQKTPVPPATGGAQQETKKMTLEELRAQHPEHCKALVAEGVKQGEANERDRVEAHLTMGEASGDLQTAFEAIKSGTAMTATLQAKYMAAGLNKGDREQRQRETAQADAIVEGAASGEPATPDLGDQVVALMDAKRGKKVA